ncbi:MAG: hypothetical protein MJ183_10140 [Treponemataceae bacterium]|nr:hypothetical protein [Treponemataceae bacterium]
MDKKLIALFITAGLAFTALFAAGLGITDDDCNNFTQHFIEIATFITNYDDSEEVTDNEISPESDMYSDSVMQMSFAVCKKFNIEGPNYAEKLEALMRSATYFEDLYIYFNDDPYNFPYIVLEGTEIKTIIEETDSDLFASLTEDFGLTSLIENIDSASWEIISEHGDDFLQAVQQYLIFEFSKLF